MTTSICRDCHEHCRFTCEHEAETDLPCPLGDDCESERLSECCGARGWEYDHDPT